MPSTMPFNNFGASYAGFAEHVPINCCVLKRYVAKEVSNYAFGKQTPGGRINCHGYSAEIPLSHVHGTEL